MCLDICKMLKEKKKTVIFESLEGEQESSTKESDGNNITYNNENISVSKRKTCL